MLVGLPLMAFVVSCGADTSSTVQIDQTTANPPAADNAPFSSAVREVGDERIDAPVLPMMGQLAANFETLAQLAAAAAHIVVVRVDVSESRPYKDVPFTVATVSVLRSLKGEAVTGGQLTVVEMGGQFAGRSKVDPGQRGTPVEVGFEGVPVMRPQQQYLLFLGGPAHVGPVLEGAYSVLGLVQGKMRVDSAGVLRFSGNPSSLDDAEFQVPQALSGRTLQAVEAEIRLALK